MSAESRGLCLSTDPRANLSRTHRVRGTRTSQWERAVAQGWKSRFADPEPKEAILSFRREDLHLSLPREREGAITAVFELVSMTPIPTMDVDAHSKKDVKICSDC